MTVDELHSREANFEALSGEQGVWAQSATDPDFQRRRGNALDEVACAVFASSDRDTLLARLIRVFATAVPIDLAILRVREEADWQMAACLGMDQRAAQTFSLPLEQTLPLAGCSCDPQLVAFDSAKSSELPPLHCLYALPLAHAGKLKGIVYLGTKLNLELNQNDQALLSTLSDRVAAAISHQGTIDALTRSIRSRDDVLSVVAHDLQNPISVISIAANMLLQRLPDAAARRSVERILRGSQRADRMIRDLLEINAIETGHFSVERRQMQPADLILSVLESQQSLAADANVILATDVSPDLPPIDADEERLLEVLENLISNAVKFTSHGGTVTVSATRRENDILVAVRDTGSGISPEQMPHIFDRFWQAKKAHRRGTGLGLTICKAIVEAHGGRIWAESTPEQGTCVSFSIPASSPTRATDSTEVANILLVDDRTENLFALSAILDRPDYRLVTATSGEEALRIALREQFSVALIDIAMPGMNGLEVAVHLKELERSRDIPIIFVTAFGDDPREIHRAYSAGGADYLVKPLDAEIVRKKVAVFVELNRKREGISRATSG